jgi:quinoprotein glucose dehydrogenase
MSRSPSLPAAMWGFVGLGLATVPVCAGTSLAPLPPFPRALEAQVVPEAGEWTAYGRDAGGSRYSPLDGIHPGNVAGLRVAWIYRTGDLHPDRGRFQSTPLAVEDRLFVTSPLGRVSAVDPGSGRELWTYDPGIDLSGSYGDFANRGPTYWRGPEGGPGGPPCGSRIFVATIDARLIALDPGTGVPCAEFGVDGEVDLTEGLRNPPRWLGEYQVTSPPAVLGDRIVVGSAIADNQRVDAPSGAVRAFHAVSGDLLWSWDPVPQDPADPAHAAWVGPDAHRSGAANAWAPLSVDPELGLVFVPTSSPSPDFYGGERLGRNDYANSLVALDGASGRVRWHFQVVHHDLWDYDIPAQPVLFPFRGDGGEGRAPVPAVAVATKMGHLFVLDRRTGEPLLPVEERPVPASDVPGEQAWPTQPFPVRPAPLTLQHLDPDGPLGATPEDTRWCRERIAGLRFDGPFTPPPLQGTLVLPGNVGGMQWGGVAVDPIRGIGVAPVNRIPFVITLVPREEVAARREATPEAEFAPQQGTPYALERRALMAPSGAPCAPPPWGSLVGVDLNGGEPIWDVPLGAAGPPAMGGAVVTAGGLAFMGGTADRTLRAFDVGTGELLWEGSLPADALATPMTLLAEGRQYVVVAAGGHDRLRALSGAPLSDHLVAFALPRSGSEGSGGPAAPARGAASRGSPSYPSMEGGWTGEVRGGSDRFSGTLELRQRRRRMEGRLVLPDADLTAELRVTAAPGPGAFPGDAPAFTMVGRFRAEGGSCRGPIRLEAELANHETLLVGLAEVQGPCFPEGSARGAFSFRRER